MAVTEKIFVAEVADNKKWYDFFPFYANVWGLQTLNDYTGISDPDLELENIGFSTDLTILSFSVRNIPYTKVSTKAEVIANDSTWYWDLTERLLLVHFKDHKPYTYFKETEIEIGKTIGFFYTNSITDGVWNNQQYHARLKSFPAFTNEKDDLFYSKQRLTDGSITIENSDLFFKNFSLGPNVENKNGNFVRILQWSGESAQNALYSEFEVLYQGLIEKITEGIEIVLDLRDIRGSLKIKSPSRYLDTNYYPDIASPTSSYPIPETWGELARVPCTCLNENANKNKDILLGDSPTDYSFMVADISFHKVATNAITTVYIDGIETDLTATIAYDTIQDMAYFILPNENFRDIKTNDNGVVTRIDFKNMNNVSVAMDGYSETDADGNITGGVIKSSMYIIREILRKHYGYEYTSTFFDTTTWSSFENDITNYDVGYYVDKPKEVQAQIGDLSLSILGKFIWTPELKFSFDNDDFTSYQKSIPKEEFAEKDYFIKATSDGTRVIKIARIGYKRKWDKTNFEEAYTVLVDESNSDNAVINYNSDFEKDFETLISNLTDANHYAERVFVFGGIGDDRFSFTVPWEVGIDLKSGEWIKVEGNHSTEAYLGWTGCQIQKISPIPAKWQLAIEVRIFGYFLIITDNNGIPLTDKDGRILLKEI